MAVIREHTPMFRSESPPPRQPSPDFLPAPLPYPRHHPRRIQSQPKIRVHSPMLLPPGLHTSTKTLQPARSCDYIRGHPHRPESSTTATSNSSLRSASRVPPARSHLSCSFSPDTSPCASPAPSHSGRTSPSPSFTPHHRRTLSVAFPSPSSSRSASPVPLINIDSQAVPPVPLIPVVPYRYTGPQHIICPKPVSIAKQIVLPDIDEIHSDPPSTVSLVASKTRLDSSLVQQEAPVANIPKLTRDSDVPVPVPVPVSTQAQAQAVPPLEKHKSMGMACLKFFGLRTATTRQPRTAMAAM